MRFFVFLLLGPVFGALVAWSLVAVMSGGYRYVDSYGIPLAYFFSLIVCVITGPVDGVLAHIESNWVRAALTAIVGAAVAIGLGLFLTGRLGSAAPLRLDALILFSIVGAVATGLCSLLSRNCGNRNT